MSCFLKNQNLKIVFFVQMIATFEGFLSAFAKTAENTNVQL